MTTDVRLIVVPYDSGHREQRMGRGPLHLVDRGAADHLRGDGVQVTTQRIDVDEPFSMEGGTAFRLHDLVGQAVAAAIADGAFPLILSGNCNTAAIGTIAGIGTATGGTARPAVVWFDAHADFNTPETTETGYLDGMGLAMATGRCWTPMTAAIPGFQAISERQVMLVGARDLEAQERIDLDRSEIAQAGVAELRQGNVADALGPSLEGLRSAADMAYVHVDVDVHDPAFGGSNHYAPEDGLRPEEVRAVVDAVADTLPVRVAAITAFDPSYDTDGRMVDVCFSLMSTFVKAHTR